MPIYQALVTIAVNFEHEGSTSEIREELHRWAQTTQTSTVFWKNRVSKIEINQAPEPQKGVIHLGIFEIDQVLPYVTTETTFRTYRIGEREYPVRMNSDRYHVFCKSLSCVVCGLAGRVFVLDKHQQKHATPHFNLYGTENGDLVMMNRDHIVPKSQGGTDDLSNLETMCETCNTLKANFTLTREDVLELRRIQADESLPKKRRRKEINTTRWQLHNRNVSTSEAT